jgi:predicted DNA-binding protein with PD1-like motif
MLVNEYKFKKIFAGKLDHGSYLLGGLTKFCEENNITIGQIS